MPLHTFPFRTFDDIAAAGYSVDVLCSSCHRTVGPIDLTDARLIGRPFTAVRFTCSAEVRRWTAEPARICGCLGHLLIKPPSQDVISPRRSLPFCIIACPRCVPYWQVNQAPKHLAPWNRIFTFPGVRLACPACRSPLTTSWSGGEGIPFTDGYRRPEGRAVR